MLGNFDEIIVILRHRPSSDKRTIYSVLYLLYHTKGFIKFDYLFYYTKINF